MKSISHSIFYFVRANAPFVGLTKALLKRLGLLDVVRRPFSYEGNTRTAAYLTADQHTLDAAIKHRSFDSMAGILGWLLTLTNLEFNDFTLNKRKALEIGTGKFFTHALGLYVCGCAEVISVDKYNQLFPDAIKLSMSTPVLARRFLSMHVSHDDFTNRLQEIRRTGYDMQRLEMLGIKYRAPVNLIGREEFHGTFDFVLSYTVFEHVPVTEVKALLKECVLALKPGGFCTHFVDLEDHRNAQDDPFGFFSAEVDWEEDMSFSRGNKLRFSTWKSMFREHENMDWRFPYVAIRHDVDLPLSIDSAIEYADEQDLRTTAFVVVGRRLN